MDIIAYAQNIKSFKNIMSYSDVLESRPIAESQMGSFDDFENVFVEEIKEVVEEIEEIEEVVEKVVEESFNSIFFASLQGSWKVENYECKMNDSVSITNDYARVTNESDGDSNTLMYRYFDMTGKRTMSIDYYCEKKDRSGSIFCSYKNVSIFMTNNKVIPTFDGSYDKYGFANNAQEVTLNTWNNITFTIDYNNTENNVAFYINGVHQETRSHDFSSHTVDAKPAFSLFNEPDGLTDNKWPTSFTSSQTFIGRLKNARIFEGILTETEIKTICKGNGIIN